MPSLRRVNMETDKNLEDKAVPTVAFQSGCKLVVGAAGFNLGDKYTLFHLLYAQHIYFVFFGSVFCLFHL